MSKIVKKAEDKIDELYSCNIFLTNKCKEFLKRNAENELKLNILSKASKEKIEKLETMQLEIKKAEEKGKKKIAEILDEFNQKLQEKRTLVKRKRERNDEEINEAKRRLGEAQREVRKAEEALKKLDEEIIIINQVQ